MSHDCFDHSLSLIWLEVDGLCYGGTISEKRSIHQNPVVDCPFLVEIQMDPGLLAQIEQKIQQQQNADHEHQDPKNNQRIILPSDQLRHSVQSQRTADQESEFFVCLDVDMLEVLIQKRGRRLHDCKPKEFECFFRDDASVGQMNPFLHDNRDHIPLALPTSAFIG